MSAAMPGRDRAGCWERVRAARPQVRAAGAERRRRMAMAMAMAMRWRGVDECRDGVEGRWRYWDGGQ